jgi:hypothetical protein
MVILTIDSLDLVEGTYKLDVAVHRKNGVPYDYHRLLFTVPCEITAQGRRDFPATSSLDVLRRHPHVRIVRWGRTTVTRSI